MVAMVNSIERTLIEYGLNSHAVLQDVLTDLKAEPEPIPIEPIKEDWLGHKVRPLCFW